MLRYLLSVSMLMACAASMAAKTPDVRPGEYFRKGDSGTLTVRSDAEKRLTFKIESIGGNCHVCSVTGSLVGGVGKADEWLEDGSDSKCRISFSVERSAMVVSPITQEECRVYCGMRAQLDGEYRIPPPICKSGSRQRLRDQSLQLYRARRFSLATEPLQKLLTQCSEFMSLIEVDQVRNDLALAQYRNGNFPQCLATLNATLAAQVKDEEELKSGSGDVYLPPCEFINYLPVAERTWFNRSLCTKAIEQNGK